MDHPDESMLLASTRHQPDVWPGGVEQHIAECLTCRARYNEYQRINPLLTEAICTPPGYLYPSITDSVMQRLHELEASSNNVMRVIETVRLRYRGGRHPNWQLAGSSLAAVAVILCTLLVFALSTNYVHIPVSLARRFAEFKPRVTIGKWTEPPRSRPTLVATATPNITVGKESPDVPSIAVCSSPTDVQQNRLRICGHNFKPGSRVALIVKIQGNRPKTLKPVLVQADGTMQDWFPIHGCGTLPSTIVVQYADRNAVLTTLGNIQFAGCDNEPHAAHQTLHQRNQNKH